MTKLHPLLLLLCCQLLALVSCADASYYNSVDARAVLESAEARCAAGDPLVCDAAWPQAEDFFAQRGMDDELVRLLRIDARACSDNGRAEDCLQKLLHAASVAEANGSEAMRAEVYADMQALATADTAVIRQTIQMQQRELSHCLRQGGGFGLGDVIQILLLALTLILIYITHQRLRIRRQNSRITALRLELQNRDHTELDGLSHLRADAAVMRFRTAIADRHDITPADWAALHEAYSRHYPQLERRLRELHSLSEVEWQVCMLLRLDFTPSDIAAFTLRSQATVSTIRSRLYAKFFMTKGSAADWDNFIQKL